MEKFKSLEDAVSDVLSQQGQHIETVSICAFYPEQWRDVREVAADPERMPEDYGVWFENVKRAIKLIEQSGRKVQLIYADVKELVQWCQAKGYQNDTQARALFASFKSVERKTQTNE